MEHNICNLINDKVKELAEAIGKDVALTAIYINQWQGAGTKEDDRTSRYPTPEELKSFYEEKKPTVDVSRISVNQNSNYSRLRQVYNSTVLSYRISDIAKRFSNEVSKQLDERIESAQQHYNWALKKGDSYGASMILAKINEYNSPEGRQAVIQDMTLSKIFSSIRDYYERQSRIPVEELTEDYGERGDYIHNEYLKILENFDALMEEACHVISRREFFKVEPVYIEDSTGKRVLDGQLGKNDSEQFSEGEDTDENEDGSKVTGSTFDYKVRLVDPYMTQSNEVRKIISNIRKVGHNGKFVTDDLGNVQTLNSEWVDQCLRSGLQGMIDAYDFNRQDEHTGQWYFPALQAMLSKYPWVSEIMQQLEDNPSLRGSFYANYRQDYIHYAGQTLKEDGTIGPTDFNKPVAEDSLFNETYNNYKEAYQLDKLSVYNVDGTLNTSNAAEVGRRADAIRVDLSNGEVSINKQAPGITTVLRAIGFNVDSDYVKSLLSSESGGESIIRVLEDVGKIVNKIKVANADIDLIEDSNQYYRNISRILGIVGEGDSISSFRDPTTKKDRNSYSAPNYMTTLTKQIKRNERGFLEREFGQDSWFRKNGEWRSGWIRLFEKDASIRSNLDIKEVPSSLGIGYTDWKSNDLKKILLREYFGIKEDPKLRHNYGWYVTPIPADAPVANFIKMKKYTGDFKKQLTPLFREVANQELDRINLCIGRAKSNALRIQNFDDNGKKFCFFPMFNNDGFMKELATKYPELSVYVAGGYTFLGACRYLKHVAKDTVALNDLLDKAITLYMDRGFHSYMSMPESLHGEIAGELLKNGAVNSSGIVDQKLEEYYWNQAYATTQMIELFVTDLAYFKDETDFQKRFKQCYAAGMKLNSVPHATDYGKEFRNNVYVKDQIITSSVYTDLKQALDEAIASGRIMDYDRDNILYKFRDVNVADAQAWITPETMRSVLDMMGKWDKQTMDPAFERFKDGKWDMSDFEIIWQTIKPFMYTQIQKPDGFGGWLRVPHQNKNSEYLVLAAFSTIAASTKGSSKLEAIHEFMRNNNIDSIQMESAVKCGGQGVVELNFGEKRLQGALTDEIRRAARARLGEKKYSEARDFDIFKEGNDHLLEKGIISQEEYNKRLKSVEMTTDEILKVLHDNVFLEDGSTFNPEVVHTIPYRDYMIQQPTPQHLIDEEGIFGSQTRNISIADLPADFSVTIGGKTYNKEEFIKEYQGCIVANVLESFNKVNDRFHNINSLQSMLMEQVRSNTAKYGTDLISALQIVTTAKGQAFKMPFSNPTIGPRMAEIMTSAYKNGVTRQYIKGGNAILVSSWGKTDKLKLEYETTKDGKKRLSAIQCYLPAYAKKFFEAGSPLLKQQVNEKGETYYELDVNKLHKAGLDKLIGYRIPTENKYSIVPLKVMGFLPQQNGSAIMLPAEITAIAGSDFDIDKLFLMIPEFEAIPSMNKEKLLRKVLKGAEFKKYLSEGKKDNIEAVRMALDMIENGNIAFSDDSLEMAIYDYYTENLESFTKYDTKNGIRKIQYDNTKSIQDNTRRQRNNHLIDLIYGMLTSQPLSAEVTSPGNFDTIKLHDRLAQILNDPQALQEFKKTFSLNTDEQVIGFIDNLANTRKIGGNNALDELNSFLKDYKKKFNTGRDPLSPETFIYNHRQNMTSGKLIGIYANNTSMHLKYQHAPIYLKVFDEYFQLSGIKINGRKITTLDLEFSSTGELITKNCAEFQAASVDGVKDPVLATLLQNEDTAKVTGLMLRLGLSIAEIAYMFNQPSVRRIIEVDGNLNNFIKDNGYATKQGWEAVLETIGTQDLTSKMLLSNIIRPGQNRYNEETANKFMAYFIWAADYLNDITSISRSDSPNGSIANSLGGAFIQTRKVDWVHNQSKKKMYPFILSKGVPRNGYTPSYEEFMQNPVATLQAFYTCGVSEAMKSLSEYFPQLNFATERMLAHLIDNANVDFLRYGEKATKTISNYFKAAIQFALGRTKLFGNDGEMTLEQKRDYYLTRFPEEFIKIKNSNEEIGNLGIIRKITSENGHLVLSKSGRLRQFTKDLYTKDLDSLANMGKVGKKLAHDLFMYSFYEDGFNFGPNSFGNFFSTDFFNNYDELMDSLRNIDTFFEDETMYQRFLMQFLSMNPKMLPRVTSTDKYHIKKGDLEKGEGNVIWIPPQISVNKTSYNGDYQYVTYNMGTSMKPDVRLYQLSQQGEISTGDYSKYVEVPIYGAFMYNPNYDLEDLVNFQTTVKTTRFNQDEDMLDNPPEDFFMPDVDELPQTPASSQSVKMTESSGSYAQRTRENVSWSDITMAFAVDDETAGERLTEREAVNQRKFVNDYAPYGFDIKDVDRRASNMFITMSNDEAYGHKGTVLKTKNVKLNIAGNGIYTLSKHNVTQDQVNNYVTAFIKKLIDLGITISEIRSGGQTGVDEAGIIAAQRLGIPASVHAPQGWRFRDASGKDISNEQAFKARFNQNTTPIRIQSNDTNSSAAAMVNEVLGGMTAEEANEELQNLTPYNTEESNEKNDTNLCTADMVSPQMKAQMTKLLRR